MKKNPIVYLVVVLALLIVSALAFPGHVTSNKSGDVANVAGNHTGVSRARTLSRNSQSKGASAQGDSNSASAATDQIAELVLPGTKNRTASSSNRGSSFVSTQATLFPTQQTSPSGPQVVSLTGPVSQEMDLRTLPYIPPSPQEEEEVRLTRYPPAPGPPQESSDPYQPLKLSAQAVAMPTPLLTFGGLTQAQACGSCLPPDTHGDVGPSHYIQSVNSSIKIFNKAGTALNGANGTTYNSFFSALGAPTACGLNQNKGDGFVFYDHLADRWVVSDFAFAGGLPGPGPFYQCVGVSKTNDPVAGGWWLYALQVDSANPTWVGDYPKMALWPDAYYLSVNMFDGPTVAFKGVRVYALPRGAMINGTGSPNTGAIAFTVLLAGLGDAYSLVPATFRTGLPPTPGGIVTPEYFMAVDSPPAADVALTQVKTWRFHVDFATPANSTFGVGANRTPDGITTVNSFVDAFTSTTLLVPQNVTAQRLDTLGDKLMTPLVYQRLGNGTESLWVSHTINNNQGGTGPTAIRWYQFNVTGSTIPATPAQQQTFNNGGDGLWRWMPSLSVDWQGNMAIGYSTSSSTSEPSIRYAGRAFADPVNTLAQGEAVLIAGGGHQTSSSGRWGDYSSTGIDPSDNCTFWHTNEYFSATSGASWNTRIGTFRFPGCVAPTAAPAMISGRVTTPDGAPLAGVTMNLSDARSAKVITDNSGNYSFRNVDIDNFYTVTPSILNYGFSPSSHSFSLLANKTDAMFTATRDAVVSGNAIDTADYFVRQHYLDFLGREPDESGFNFWSDQITSCSGDAACIERRTINVSAAYFLSIEFQQTGGLVDGLYRASYGRAPRYAEFMPDTAAVAQNIIVGASGKWPQVLEANKQAFVDAWVQRAEFRAAYDGLSNSDFVDALIAHAGAGFNGDEDRAALVNGLNAGTMTRAAALRQVVENEGFVRAKSNKMFVMMEYFGYLRRDPDESGYQFWLNKLNQFDGNFEQAEMVKAFIVSGEYRNRFR